MVFALIGAYKPIATIVLATLGLGVCILLGFVYLGLGSFIGILIGVIFLAWSMRA